MLKHLMSQSLVLLLLALPALAGPVRDISPAEARELLASKPSVMLLDVRTAGEYMQARIAGARLIPIDQVIARIGEIPKNKPVLVYCAVGSRSSQVAGYLAQQGNPEVYNMSGGIMGWQVRGYPLLRGAP
jgi:rhodanese-related sulfurtransferase